MSGAARPSRLTIKQRKYVVGKMKELVDRERSNAVRGTKKLINKLTSDYKRDTYAAVNARVGKDEMTEKIMNAYNKFKSGIKSVDMRDKLEFPPLRDPGCDSDSAASTKEEPVAMDIVEEEEPVVEEIEEKETKVEEAAKVVSKPAAKKRKRAPSKPAKKRDSSKGKGGK
jgi:hypothetical protein